MIPAARREEILSLVREKHSVEVEELSHLFQVSEVTIRQDLNLLADQKLITRTRGGAVLKNHGDSAVAFSDRVNMNAEKKRLIGNLAAGLVEPSTSVFLDASTTALHVARAITQKPKLGHMTIITNGLYTAIELLDRPDITTIVIGGLLSNRSISLNGLFIEEQLKAIHCQKGFFGAKALSLKHGLTEVGIVEANTKTLMMKKCQEIIAIVDSSKFDQVASAKLASLEKIFCLVTDSEAPPGIVDSVRAMGIDVKLA
jgi:DeoR family fructose operon transcriptional repressor